MPTLKMSEMWDKLCADRFIIGKEFTTFRGYTPRKAAYYWKKFDNKSVFHVVLLQEDKPSILLGTARMKSIEYKWSGELTLTEIREDTYSTWCRLNLERFLEKQYGTKRVFGIFMSFRIIDTHMGVLK